MAACEDIYSQIHKLTKLPKPLGNKFKPLNGLSQQAKDKMKNQRRIKPPKNICLIEGDPEDETPDSDERQDFSRWPGNFMLSSQIREAHGEDFSNYSIEQCWGEDSISKKSSPEVSTNSTDSPLLPIGYIQLNDENDESAKSLAGNSVVNGKHATNSESLIDCSDIPAEQGGTCIKNRADDVAFDNSRYAKNALIRGLLKKNIISGTDLQLKNEIPRKHCPNVPSDSNLPFDVRGTTECNGTDRPEVQLVPHPDDPDVYTHPFQAYGKVDDDDVDYTLPRIGKKTTYTPRQHFMELAADDSMFNFLPQRSESLN